MRAAMMNCIKIFDVDAYDEVLCKQPLLSLQDGSRMLFHPLHMLSGDGRPVTTWLSREAACVARSSNVRATLESMPPPQVDVYIFKNARVKVIGKRRSRTLRSLITRRAFHISSAKKVVIRPCQVPIGDCGKVLVAKKTFQDIFAACAPRRSKILLPELLLIPGRYGDCFSRQFSLGIEDIQTYSRLVGMQRGIGDRRKGHNVIVLEMQGGPIFEGEQKKGGKRPEPGKSKPDKPETGKQKREGDKGSQRVKRPKKAEQASTILQQGFYGLVIILRWLG